MYVTGNCKAFHQPVKYLNFTERPKNAGYKHYGTMVKRTSIQFEFLEDYKSGRIKYRNFLTAYKVQHEYGTRDKLPSFPQKHFHLSPYLYANQKQYLLGQFYTIHSHYPGDDLAFGKPATLLGKYTVPSPTTRKTEGILSNDNRLSRLHFRTFA